jgi:predicted Zn-dependent peptidase
VKSLIAVFAALTLIAAAPSAAPSAAPASAPGAAVPVVTRNGGVTMITQHDPAAPLVHVVYLLRAGLDRQSLSQNGLAALTAQTILDTPVNGTPLDEAVSAAGGRISFSVDPNDVRFEIETLPEDAAKIIALVRTAIAAPSFTPAVVKAARDALISRIAENEQVALQVGLDMLSSVTAASANAGLPQYGLPASLAQFGIDDVKSFYATYYRRGGSYVSAAGRIDALPAGTLDDLGQAVPDGSTTAVAVKLPKLEGSSRQLVAERDISAPWLIAQYNAPAISSKDFGPMLVLASFMQRTLSDMAGVPGVVSDTYASHAVGAVYQYADAQPTLVLYVNGGIGNPNQSFSTALSIASILATTKLEGSIDDFKAAASGDFISSMNSLESRAWLAVVYDMSGVPPDYLGRTLDAIQQTTPADLQRVARAYLSNPTIALVLPRDDDNS